jgi:hypothetical protein
MNYLFFYFVWTSFLICVFLAWFFSHKARHEERKMLIRQGANPDESQKSGSGFRFPWLTVGMLVLGLSIGLGIIALLANFRLLGNSDAIFPAILGICGGSSLIIAHFIDKRGK